jgi:hypothetical protein
MIRFLPISIGCMAAFSFTAAWAQNGALLTNEVGLRANEAAAAAAAAPAIAADRQHPRLAGFWEPETPAATLQIIGAKAPPMTAEGQRIYRQRTAAIRANKADDPANVCLPPGTPRDMLSPGPFLIAQTPAKITVFHQYRHLIRHVYLDGPLKLDEPDPWWQGHVSGYWDGDVLVMETAAFNGQQWLDSTGLPQSPDMKVVERFRLTSPNTLEDLITIEDGKYYTKPWTARVTFRRLPVDDLHLVQEECGEKLLEYPLKAYAPGG